MNRLILMVALLGALAAVAVAQEDVPATPARLANGKPIEGAIQETNTEGMVFQTSTGPLTVPWKYLSPGTRYRHERPFLVAQEIARSNALVKAKAAAAAAAKAAAAKAAAKPQATTNAAAGKPGLTNVAAPAANVLPSASGTAATTNVSAPAGAKDSATNAPAKKPEVPAKKKRSRNVL